MPTSEPSSSRQTMVISRCKMTPPLSRFCFLPGRPPLPQLHQRRPRGQRLLFQQGTCPRVMLPQTWVSPRLLKLCHLCPMPYIVDIHGDSQPVLETPSSPANSPIPWNRTGLRNDGMASRRQIPCSCSFQRRHVPYSGQ